MIGILTTNVTDLDLLEEIIDRHTLSDVLVMLSNICLAKAEHIRTNWQDAPLARAWERDSKVVGKTADRCLGSSFRGKWG